MEAVMPDMPVCEPDCWRAITTPWGPAGPAATRGAKPTAPASGKAFHFMMEPVELAQTWTV